jgi:hypothetical protein
MLVALTVRKLKPGTYDQFIQAWRVDDDMIRATPPESPLRKWKRAYTVRSVNDPDLIVSFGFFDGTLEELRAGQRESGYSDHRAALDELIESTGTDELFEVTEEVEYEALAARLGVAP